MILSTSIILEINTQMRTECFVPTFRAFDPESVTLPLRRASDTKNFS